MSENLNLYLAQLNPILGDINYNVEKIIGILNQAPKGTDLIIFSELVVTGYPPEDLILKPFFLKQACDAVYRIASYTSEETPALLISSPWVENDKAYNAAMLLADGKIQDIRYKHHLPNYGVFDELRIFERGPLPEPIEFKGHKLGVLTCEDMWYEDVTRNLADKGAEILIALNGSPFETDKHHIRMDNAISRVKKSKLALVYLNQIGGQDELVFDGASFVLNKEGEILTRMTSHHEQIITTTWQKDSNGMLECIEYPDSEPELNRLESIYQTLILGLRDYVEKNRFPGVVIGMSGGVDSALSAAIAADALGSDKVHCIMMPSPYTSDESLEDASACSKALGIRHDSVSIEPAMEAFDTMLSSLPEGYDKEGVAAENIQARSRGITLMGISNSTGYMVLSTGNKSEMSVGYATLYGDMCGGYSVLKDVYKTTVFELCEWRNQNRPKGALAPNGEVIPQRIITKPPSAELRPDQIDEDSLPPYAVLDDILECLIECEMGLERITARGHDPEVINRIWRMLDFAEYKRRQAPPGVKITSKAFGRDRRYPITNRFINLLS